MARIKFSDDGQDHTDTQQDERLKQAALDAKAVVEEEDDSDSDAAPEEEGFQDSRDTVVKQQRQKQALISQQRAEERKGRRERDEQLKKQKSQSTKRQSEKDDEQEDNEKDTTAQAELLDASLLEEMETSDLVLPNQQKNKKIKFDGQGLIPGSDRASTGPTKSKKKKETLKEARERLELKSKSLSGKVVKKGPVTVSVLKKNSKSLMPPKSQVIDQLRDRWYQESQKVVERRARR